MRCSRVALAVAACAGCGNLLGLSPPHEQLDAPGLDAPPDAGPSTLHVVTGGTAGSAAGVITSDPAGIACPGTCDFAFAHGAQVTLTASAAGSSDDIFTGFYGGGCAGSAGSAATCALTVTADATIFARYFDHRFLNVMFVSSTAQAPGSFDSVANADALCNQLAGSAGLPGPFVSYLSTSTESARQRLDDEEPSGTPVGVWARPDGRLVTLQQAQLVAGDIQFPPRLDEFGRDVGDDALAVTGTTGSGSAEGGAPCQDYASTGDPAAVLAGEPAGGTDRWSSVTAIECDAPAHLYCLGMQTNPGNTFSPSVGPTVIFVSKFTMTGSGGVANADAQCAAEAAAVPALMNRSANALLTPGGGMPVASRFLHQGWAGPAQRPDSVAIAPSMTDLLAGMPFQAVPNLAADFTYEDVDVWLGGGGFADFVEDCNGWTSDDPSAHGATRPAATTRGPTFFTEATCDQPRHVLCTSYLPLTQ